MLQMHLIFLKFAKNGQALPPAHIYQRKHKSEYLNKLEVLYDWFIRSTYRVSGAECGIPCDNALQKKHSCDLSNRNTVHRLQYYWLRNQGISTAV